MLIGDCRAKFHLTIVQDEQEEFFKKFKSTDEET